MPPWLYPLVRRIRAWLLRRIWVHLSSDLPAHGRKEEADPPPGPGPSIEPLPNKGD